MTCCINPRLIYLLIIMGRSIQKLNVGTFGLLVPQSLCYWTLVALPPGKKVKVKVCEFI